MNCSVPLWPGLAVNTAGCGDTVAARFAPSGALRTVVLLVDWVPLTEQEAQPSGGPLARRFSVGSNPKW